MVREGAFSCPVRHFFGFGANVAMTEVVWGAEQNVELLVQDVAHAGGASLLESELLCFAVVLELHELVSNGVKGFVPADGHKTRVNAASLLGIRALHGGLDTIGIVDLLNGKMRLRADFAIRCCTVPVSRNAKDALILRVYLHRARGGASLAGGCGPLAGLIRLMGLIGHGGKRRCHPRCGCRSQPQSACFEERASINVHFFLPSL